MGHPVYVWLPEATEPTLAGEFSHTGNVGRFEYSADYLAAGHPALAPDIPRNRKSTTVTGGLGIFPIFLDAGPDTWGRHLLERRLGRAVSELEALTLCPTDGVGNIALGPLSQERLHVLKLEEFLELLIAQSQGTQARTPLEEQVMDAHRRGTSLGGTKPKLSIERNGIQYLAKFPAQGDSPWLPHLECATLKLARSCGVRTLIDPEVWRLPTGATALLVPRFDRHRMASGSYARTAYVSAHALLRLDMHPPQHKDMQAFATLGFSPAGMRKSYVSLAQDMLRWSRDQTIHQEERRELWRRIVFNALIRNLDDHPRNHGLICENMARQQWRLSPAFDLVPTANLPQNPALCMAYHYIPPGQRGRAPNSGTAPRLISVIETGALLAAAEAHYGYTHAEATAYLHTTAQYIAEHWQTYFSAEGMPETEINRFRICFSLAQEIAWGQGL